MRLLSSGMALVTLLLFAFLLAALAHVAHGQSLNFSLTLVDGATTPFNLTSVAPPLLVQFSTVAGSGIPGSFVVQSSFFSFPGEVIANSYDAGAQLQLQFDPAITRLSFLYALFENGTVSAKLRRAGRSLANVSLTPTYNAEYVDFEGLAVLPPTGQLTFDTVVLTGVRAVNFAAGALSGVEAAMAVGDPQFLGLRGQSFQVHGIANSVYALLSSASMQLNARFVFLGHATCTDALKTVHRSPCWSHAGNYFGEIGVTTAAGQALSIVAGPAELGFQSVHLRLNTTLALQLPLLVGQKHALLPDSSFADGGAGGDSGESFVELLSSHRLLLSCGEWLLELANSDGFINLIRVEVSRPLAQLDVHGLLGQTARAESTQRRPLEGEVDDYVIADSQLLGHQFAYTRHAQPLRGDRE